MSEVILQVDGLRLRRNAESINLSIRTAEIVGLAGLDGHGQEDFLETLYGLRVPIAGQVVVETAQGATLIKNAATAGQGGGGYFSREPEKERVFSNITGAGTFYNAR